ncbi:MAG: hypothetical protein WDO68_31165 [Gammaproteobacteria bacterium]
MKKPIGTMASILLCCALPSAYAANPFGDLVKNAKDAIKNAAQPQQPTQVPQPEQLQQTPQQGQQQAAQAQQLQNAQAVASAAALNAPCAQPAAKAEKTSFGEQARKLALQGMLASATNSLTLEEAPPLPAPVKDVCTAQKRLVYVNRATRRWSMTVIKAITQAKQALDLKEEAQSYASFKDSVPEFGQEKSENIARLQRDMENDLQEIKKAIEAKRGANTALLAEANANMKGALAQGGLIAVWDKRLIEFVTDNRKWALDNWASVSLLGDHAKLLGSTMSSVSAVTAAQPDSDDKTRRMTASIMKEREAQNLQDTKQLEKELQL